MDNPYQAGGHHAHPSASPSGSMTPAILQSLAGTKPWVRLCSVMGFIGAGFMILGGIVMMVSGAALGLSNQQTAGLAGMPVVIGVMYLVFSLLYLIPSIKLWKYGSAIYRLLSTNSVADLENAMEQQRGFWKFVGIMILIMLVFMVVAIVGGALVGAAAASAVRP